MKIGDLVKNMYNDKVGIIIGCHPPSTRIVGVVYTVFVDGLEVHLHETELELI